MNVGKLKDMLKDIDNKAEIGVSVKKRGIGGTDSTYVSDKTKVKVEIDNREVREATVWITGEWKE